MLKKIKNSKVAKWLSVMCVTALIAAFGCLTVFAADGETSAPDLQSTVTSSFNGISDSIFTYIGIALPIALGIVAAIFGIKFAIRFFKSIASK